MLNISQNVSLTERNTLAIRSKAQYVCEIDNEADIPDFFYWMNSQSVKRWMVLGGGSNVILPSFYRGCILFLRLLGKRVEVINRDEAYVYIGAGENWHQVVCWVNSQGYRGIENLALIPGNAGAAPVQNIGAYGVEIKDTLVSVRVWDIEQNRVRVLVNSECQFSYRDSLFKVQSGRYLILEIKLLLSKSRPFQLDYDGLNTLNVSSLVSPQQVSDKVIEIRQSKLPDPSFVPNAGSFFKNPVIDTALFNRLRVQYPDLKYHAIGDGFYKIPAAWLIDQSGWKGYRSGRVGVHDKQALVLVNHGGSQQDVVQFAERIQRSVYQHYSISLDIEPVAVLSS